MQILIPLIPHSTRHDKGMSRGFSNANFPLGVAYVVAAIRKAFPDVRIYIAHFDLLQIDSEEQVHFELAKIAKTFSPDFILFGGMITRYHYIINLSRIAREFFPNAVQVLGGGAPTWGHSLFVGEAPIDYMTLGEAEETIVSILGGANVCDSSIYQSSVNNLPTKALIRDLDTIPIPSHSDFSISEYVNIQQRITGWRTMPIVASRGCPFRCQFCSPSANDLRVRSADNVVEEMKFLKVEYGVDSIYFWDELQFVKKPWFEEFCRHLIADRVNLKWVFVTRATLIREKDVPLLRLAREAGCVRIAVGIESGSETILKAMNKNTKVVEMEAALKRVRSAGIKATGSMLLGFPGEDKTTIQDSIDFANRNLLQTSFYNLIPLPGTEVYEHFCKKSNLICNEKEYMLKVSRSGGDASNIVMNLTDLDDRTYIDETARANRSVMKIGLRSAIDYYGVLGGVRYGFEQRIATIKRRLTGRTFDTP